ncbi:glutathione S-transferase family protein [Paraglaciecola sp. MB-3u-78]|jgi:glutathione S-transferase|uniref:glutathione S-transferase family protein n=1 Tax=Paraglaciecola sp. MB-3u-78 TaxID=2058332 RepID=UPI000C32E10E|nr:glutathione S-transferase [Paraglaciecola sp. MB-3u-78]PKH00060.1 glutathione S-transferase [Paraglaciecola sp. MB-3u-78]
MSNAIRIHSFPLSGHAHRVQLFASVAGIAHQIVHVDLPAGEHKQAPFLSLNPLGVVPVIEDGDAIVHDSISILIYLARKYAPAFIPEDLQQEAEMHRFLAMSAGEISYGVGAARLINVFNSPSDPLFAKATAEKALIKLEQQLVGRDFLVANKISLADFAIYSYVAHAPEGDVSLEPYPNVRRWLTNIESLKGFVPMQATKVGLAA